MRREKEFRAYLQNRHTNNNTIEAYISYCKKVEEAFGGKDMDKIIVSHLNLVKARVKLGKITGSKKTVGDCISGLNHYLEFAFEYGALGNSVRIPVKIDSFAGPIVQYYSDVPVCERSEVLRKALEDEYPKILQFAKNALGVDYGYIPVYLSKETPPPIMYKLSKKFMDKLCNKNQEQREMSNKERDLINRIIDGKCYVANVVAQFFSGTKPYIEIYYKNLPVNKTLETTINCLAHEYMHFVEYVYTAQNGVLAFVDERVSEALAEFFGFLYSIKRGNSIDLEIAEDSYITWKVLDGSGWPYAYALYFMKKRISGFSPIFVDYKNKGCINKLIEVFNATPNVVDAYDKLINL